MSATLKSRTRCESQGEPASQKDEGVRPGRRQGGKAPTKGRQPNVFCQQYSRSLPKVGAPAVPITSRRKKAGKASAMPPLPAQEEGERPSLDREGEIARAPAAPSVVGFEIVTPPPLNGLDSLAQTAEGNGDKPQGRERLTAVCKQTGRRARGTPII